MATFLRQFLPVLNCYSYLPANIVRLWLDIRRKKTTTTSAISAHCFLFCVSWMWKKNVLIQFDVACCIVIMLPLNLLCFFLLLACQSFLWLLFFCSPLKNLRIFHGESYPTGFSILAQSSWSHVDQKNRFCLVMYFCLYFTAWCLPYSQHIINIDFLLSLLDSIFGLLRHFYSCPGGAWSSQFQVSLKSSK